MYYTQSLNIKLLMNLGAHIGHAKIDWNTDNNALLAGLTNNNYILFNINKTLFYFKRCLIFMHSIGYNNGKFVIYYPGDDPFYRLTMETALDRDGLLPTKYPFIHSLVKPGFFSNWRVNYKKLVRQFFKVIFWNPYFFGGMTTQFLYDKINKEVLKKGINSYNLSKLRSTSRRTIQAMTMPLKIFKRMRKPHYKAFKPNYKIHKKIINKNYAHDSNFKLDRSSVVNSFYATVKLNTLEKYKCMIKKSVLASASQNTIQQNATINLYELKRNIFMKQTSSLERLFLSVRYYGGHPHFIIYNTPNKLPMCCYNSNLTSEKKSYLDKLTNSIKSYEHNLFGNFITRFIPFNNYISKQVLQCYFYLRSSKSDLDCKKFLKNNPVKRLVIWSNYINIVNRVKQRLPVVQRSIALKKKIASLTPEQLKKRKKLMYYKKLGITNKYIFSDYFNHVNKSGYRYDNKFKLKNHSDKIHRNMSQILNRGIALNNQRIINYRNNKVRTESLKMLYYNLYNLLVMISMRNITYNNKNDDLTPYEQKYFKRFVKFVLIFRYLKRIKSVPSAILLLNSDVHESQYTDFKTLNTSVIGLLDSNIQFTSLSYFIPTNDDNLLLFLYYIKILAHTYTSGRKHFLLEHLTPKFSNNLARKLNYSIPFIYQYKDKLSNDFQLLPFGSILDRLHIERLEKRRKEREERQAMFKKWEEERKEHWRKKATFRQDIHTVNRKNLFELNKILNIK